MGVTRSRGWRMLEGRDVGRLGLEGREVGGLGSVARLGVLGVGGVRRIEGLGSRLVGGGGLVVN